MSSTKTNGGTYIDFSLSCRGARLINGECKDTASNAAEGMLVLHTADQFGYKDSSLSMLTTSNGTKFFNAQKDTATGAMRTTFFETHKHKLDPLTPDSFKQDQHTEDDDLQMPPKFHLKGNEKLASFSKKDKECIQDWSDLRSECKWFVIVVLQAIDVIYSEVLCMDLKQVVWRGNRCFNAG